MKLSDFIREHCETLLADWARAAEQVRPNGEDLTDEELRDAAVWILKTLAADIDRLRGQQGATPDEVEASFATRSVAQQHAAHRLLQHFSLEQVSAEYRKVRTNITLRWIEAVEEVNRAHLKELALLNEAIDLSMAEAVAWYGRQLRSAHEELLASDQAKDLFLAILGHELRNPLAPLYAGVHLLKQGDSEMIAQVRPMMERQLAHLQRLVDDLLDVSRIRRGRFTMRRTPVDLSLAVETAVEQVKSAVEHRRHKLVIKHLNGALPIVGDFDRLTQVIANLLSNAAKYTAPGGTIIVQTQAEHREAVLKVCDTGLGIPPHRMERLFDMFSQIPEHNERNGQSGLGIGLALSNEIVRAHGGTIEARSPGLNRGSEFIVRLPMTNDL